MASLRRLLGIDPLSRSQRRAGALVAADRKMLRDLIDLRKQKGLSQRDVAERLGVSQENISAFERHDNDPKLSTIRRYAHAIEAIVVHVVEPDVGQLESPHPTFSVTLTPVEQNTVTHTPDTEQRVISAKRVSVALAA